MAAAIRPDKLLRELDELWVKLGQEAEQSGGVLRSCSMTLLVAAEGEEDAQSVPETLAQLMRDHPSRAVVLRLMPGQGRQLDARVYAQCWMPFGGRQQICCEHIEISFCSGSLPEVAPLAAGLVAPDLPVVLWCRSPQLLALGDFRPVLQLAGKVILDSAGVPDLGAQLQLIEALRGLGYRVADLAWTRLTRWRETIAKVFDHPEYLDRLGAISRVNIAWDGAHLPMSACYFAAWLRAATGRKLDVTFQHLESAPRARLHAVSLNGDGVNISLSVSQDRNVDLQIGGHETHAVFPSLTDYELLREELFILVRDRAWEAMLPLAEELAEAG
jgi:glucose-6-phosphate dehydrogenase assembly protein OpcA